MLLEAAYFAPMAIARTSKRLGLRTEASARFERGCDPWGIEPSVARFCQVLRESVPGLRVADGMIDVRGDVPMPFTVSLPVARVQRQIGVPLGPDEIADLIEPIGFSVLDRGQGASGDLEAERITVSVPTNRPDVRPEPYGVDDVIEEVARTFGYSNVPRHMPTWPQPGALTSLQRSRRLVKDVLCGLGASEGWTDTFVSAADHEGVGLSGPAVRVSNPLDGEKPFLRRTLLPGLLRALAYNAGRRQPDVRLFEVGVVFSHPDEGSQRVFERAGAGEARRPCSRESARWSPPSSPARATTPAPRSAAWDVLADTLRLAGVRLASPDHESTLPGLHPTRSARLVAHGPEGQLTTIGSVGEVDPDVAVTFGVTRTTGGAASARRVGWLEVDLGLLLDETVVPRRLASGGAVSRFPSSDIDLALVVDDRYPADAVADSLRAAAGDVLESVRLFDVYRGPGIAEAARWLAYRLRFCSPERTLTDEEVGELRAPLHPRRGEGVRRRPALIPSLPGPGGDPRQEPAFDTSCPAARGIVGTWRSDCSVPKTTPKWSSGTASCTRSTKSSGPGSLDSPARRARVRSSPWPVPAIRPPRRERNGRPDPGVRLHGGAAARQPPQRGGHGSRSTRPTGAAASGPPSSRRWVVSRPATVVGSSMRSSTCQWTGRRTTPRSTSRQGSGSKRCFRATSATLAVPVEPVRLEELRRVVAQARDAGDYRTFTFEAPWPAEYLDDECELFRRMSTDEPSGDADREEEVWTRDRLRESDELRRRVGCRSSSRWRSTFRPDGSWPCPSCCSPPTAPLRQAWQLITLVHPEHRGHRLGLAVKLANLDFLADRAPAVRTIRTGNAEENAR